MKKAIVFVTILFTCCASADSQIAVAKIVGKNAKNYKLGYGLFSYYDFPLNGMENSSFRIELLDGAYFPSTNDNVYGARAYVSIKAGYKYTFSEAKTGFFIEPQVGYCRAIDTDDKLSKAYGDGVALAGEVGYTLEVGERGHALNFGLKYETDMAGTPYTISSIGFRFSYSFNLFKRKED